MALADYEGLFDFSNRSPFHFAKSLLHTTNEVLYTLPNIITQKKATKLEDLEPWGGYYPSNNSNLNDSIINCAILRHYHNNPKYSTLQIKYLIKIIDLCKECKIDIIIVNTPLHTRYSKMIPIDFKNKFTDILRSISEDIIHVDGNGLELDDTCFGDGDHLNKKGAQIFTNHTISIMNKTKKKCNITN